MTRLQIAVIDTLLRNSSVQTLLGNTAPATGSVYEEQSFNVESATYPRVHVGIAVDTPHSIEQVRAYGGKRVHTTFLDLHVFSKRSTSAEVGNIEDAIEEALDGAEIRFPGLHVYHIEYDSHIASDRDTETGLWHSVRRYRATARRT